MALPYDWGGSKRASALLRTQRLRMLSYEVRLSQTSSGISAAAYFLSFATAGHGLVLPVCSVIQFFGDGPCAVDGFKGWTDNTPIELDNWRSAGRCQIQCLLVRWSHSKGRQTS